MAEFHPELRRAARMIPRFTFTPGLGRFVRFVQRMRGVPKPPSVQGMTIRDVTISRFEANPLLRVRLYVPRAAPAPCPAMLWIHGGGFILGTPNRMRRTISRCAGNLPWLVAAVDYRLGPDHPYPAALDDCYAALAWLHRSADDLGVAPDRVAIGGNSAEEASPRAWYWLLTIVANCRSPSNC